MAESSPHSPSPSPAANFDRVARMYRWAEYLCYGPLLQRVRTSLLDELATSRRVLVLGDGDGRFLAQFLRRNTQAKVLAVDTSEGMLRLLRERCLANGSLASYRLRTIKGSALEITASRDTDLVVSHFFLDCLSAPELAQLAQQLAHSLAPGARWLISDFAVPSNPLLRAFASAYIRGLYAVFRLLTGLRVSRLPPISEALHAAGFQRLKRRDFAAGMLYSEVWQLGTPPNTTRSQPWAEDEQPADIMQTNTEIRPAHNDAQSNPEPPVPSLPEPDPAVFHHAPAASPQPPRVHSSTTEKTGA